MLMADCSAMSPMSAPAAHAFSLPASRKTMTDGSLSSRSIVSASSFMSAGLRALSTLGRLRRMMATGPSCSTRMRDSSAVAGLDSMAVVMGGLVGMLRIE